MSIEVVTYHSTNAKPSEAWLAYVENNGIRWMVQFAAATEEAAKAKALDVSHYLMQGWERGGPRSK